MASAGARQQTAILIVLLMGLFITNVDVAVVNVAIPSIHARLNASASALQLVVSGYVLSYAMLLITGARLGAMAGYRRLFLLGTAIFTVASLSCGLAPDAIFLIFARVVQGTGAALMVPQVLIGIQANFHGRARAQAIGFYSVALSIGAVAGQVLGGALVSANLFGTGWRPIFLINVPIGAVVLVAAARVLPRDRKRQPSRLDLWGVATLSAAVLLATLPLILGHTAGWPAWVWICLLASVAPFIAFVATERRIARRGGHPLINVGLLARPAIAWGFASYAAASMTYFSLLFILALFLQQGFGKSALYSGLALVSWVAAFGLGGPLAPILPARASPFVAPVGYVILGGAYLAIGATASGSGVTTPVLFALLGVGGFGLGLGYTANIRRLVAAASDRYAPDMSGLITMFSQVAGVVGVATFGTLYFSLVPRPSPETAARGFTIIALGLALTALLSAAAAYRSSHAAGVEPRALGEANPHARAEA